MSAESGLAGGLDGDGRAGGTAAPAGRGAPPLNLRALLAPRSVAVIGASPDPGRHNGRPIANLLRTGFAGAIHPVNPRHETVAGLPCADSVLDIDTPVDLAYVMVRADLVEKAVTECAQAGVPAIVVCTSGFAEEGGAGAEQQQRLRDIAWAGGSRLVGPNCIGVAGIPENAVSCTTLNVTTTFTPGSAAIVSQSGGMAANLFNIAQGEGIGVRAMLSLGNEADVDVADVVLALADDPQTDVVLLYVEQVRDFPRFASAVARARATGTRVLALKAGRTAAGTRSTKSHTGAMSGSFEVFRDVMTSIGVVVVDSIPDLLNGARVLQQLPLLRGRRLLVVSPSGGECGYVSDRAESSGLSMPDLSEELRAELAGAMRFGTPGNPLDLTGQVIGDEELLDSVFGIIAKYDEFDAVLVALPTWGEFDSARLMPPLLHAARRSGVPLAISAWRARNLTEYRDELLDGAGVAHFDSADRAVDALAVLADLSERAAEAAADESATGTPEPVDVPAEALANEADAKAFLAAQGVPVSQEWVAADLAGARAIAAGSGWPLVVKGIAPGVGHKSELGLVALGVRDKEALERAVTGIEDAARQHGVDLEGYLLARQYEGLEVILGMAADPEFGRVLLLGAGGVLAEVMDDKAFLRCPASRADVERALRRLRIGRVLAGHRGRTYDVESLVDLVVGFSERAPTFAGVEQIDLNPVIVREGRGGSVVVDALLVGR
ncbi:acetate--CoA ligase family protein [Blastococcus sp. SYSU DS0533]